MDFVVAVEIPADSEVAEVVKLKTMSWDSDMKKLAYDLQLQRGRSPHSHSNKTAKSKDQSERRLPESFQQPQI